MTTDIHEQKAALRKAAHANRRAQDKKDELSRTICGKFMSLPEYDAAQTVQFYIDVRAEVRTRHDLPLALESGKRIIVPYCIEGEVLELFLLEDIDELEIGMYKILEPKESLRRLPEKCIDVGDIDLIMVPGVAFDRRGARMGHGKGYYDKLLQDARPETPLVALAFECQLFDEVPVDEHDIYMDKIITEKAIYEGKGRAGGGR